MLNGFFIIIVTGVIAYLIIGVMKRRHPFIDTSLLMALFYYHVILAFVYYLYARFNPSDSNRYYENILINFRGESWGSFYGTSTTFIEFIAYPLVKYLSFSYEACMALFAFFGYLGFLYFYVFYKEQVKFKHKFFGVDLMTIIFFLPNLHFWSSSLGKGSTIFMGISLMFFGIGNIRQRWIAILIGSLVVYHVRPHIMLVILVSSAIGMMFSSKQVSVPLRVLFVIGASIVFFFIYSDVLKLVGIDEEEFLTQGLDLSRRARELSNATSGVDISNYSLPMKMFTFLYRPLFIDAPGALGIIVSFENVFYLALTLRLFNAKGLSFLLASNFLIKTAFFSFITITIALAQISGNLGLAIRQKSQVMLLLLFVVMTFLDSQSQVAYNRIMVQRRKMLAKANANKARTA